MNAISQASLHRHAFPALGGEIELLLEAVAAPSSSLWGEIEQLVAHLEDRLSRFRPESALSLLNATGSIHGQHELAEVVSLALAARERTGGLFDPTVHDALVEWGYDRSFAQLGPDHRPAPTPGPCGGEVEVELGTGTVRVAPGVRLDLGGIAKGFIVDRAADLLASAGACLVNAAGDLAVQGTPAGTVWPIGVDTPGGSTTLGLPYGGLATSGVDRRRWRRGNIAAHHLIDPRTGAPSASDLLRVTAAGACAVDAEVNAKTLLLAGLDEALQLADVGGIPTLLITRAGETYRAGGMT